MGRPALVSFMTHIDSVIHNIQLVSSLLYSYWPTTSEELYFLEVSTIFLPTASQLMEWNIMIHPICSNNLCQGEHQRLCQEERQRRVE